MRNGGVGLPAYILSRANCHSSRRSSGAPRRSLFPVLALLFLSPLLFASVSIRVAFPTTPATYTTPIPEGNYAVTLTLGGPDACVTTVEAESRRLMLDSVPTRPGETISRTVIVNVRNSRLPAPPPENAPGGDRVRLNQREQGVLHWDDQLSLAFTGPHPCVQAVWIVNTNVPTIYLAGDSTVTDQPKAPTTSWGQILPRFFQPVVAVANHAESGETLKSFFTSLRLDKILSQIQPGDWLFIQFGHNDQKENWPQTYAPALTTYKQYLKLYIAEARRKGATPVLITSMHRRNFGPDGKIRNTLGDYPEAVRQTAREENVALIDLNTMSAALYESLGPDRSLAAFANNGRDGTHHSAYGASLLAQKVVDGIRAANLPIAQYLSPDLPPFPCAQSPCYYTVPVPKEGNYKVAVTLGDRDRAGVTTIKSELRRLMVERVETKPGEFVTRSFLVNVRTPQYEGGEVRLKDRERTSEAVAWDRAITLEFTNTNPVPAAVTVEPVDVPTLYIAGDSTSTDQPSEPFNSWGQMITRFFKPEIAIANHGESGESLRSFIAEHRLEKILTLIKPGDWLFIQMGHNDQKERGEGVGAFTTYQQSLHDFIQQARAHGANPVLITPVSRAAASLGDYPEAVRRQGREDHVPVLDLYQMSRTLYDSIGPADLPKAFADNDTTHHNNYGSSQLAKCVVELIRAANLPLVRYLVDGLPKYDPAHPDSIAAFDIPAEPRGVIQRPYGQ